MTEWRDLPTLPDVAAAQAAGDEIERRSKISGRWETWDGNAWDASAMYRARPRKPATKTIVLRRALLKENGNYWTPSPSTEDYSQNIYFVMWLPGEEVVEVPA